MKCPMCGAPALAESPLCEHCGARLATVACPSCFGMMFVGEKFCPHCGAEAQRAEVAEAQTELCPRCRTNMDAVVVGNTNLRECPRCEGIWADAESLQKICADREQQSAVLGMPSSQAAPVETNEIEDIHYIPCPVCGALMNRVCFAHCSHVIVNVCAQHGTWFDRDELRKIVEFIRAGGMEKAREVEIAQLEDARRMARAATISGGMGSPPLLERDPACRGAGLGISIAGEMLKIFLGSRRL